MSAWKLIPPRDNDLLWDRFEASFAFRPSTSIFPGITEPVPSVTCSIGFAYASPPDFGQLNEKLEDAALRLFDALAETTGRVIALDWQHDCYYFHPSRHDGLWHVPPLPNGDYSIFLSDDMTDGWFAHPWELTICVFGRRAVAALESALPMGFPAPVRKDGQPVF